MTVSPRGTDQSDRTRLETVEQNTLVPGLVGRLSPHLSAKDVAACVADIEGSAPLTARAQHVADLSLLTGKVPTDKELAPVLEQLAHDPKLPWRYIPEPCEARADAVARVLTQKQGFVCAKIFVLDARTGPDAKYCSLTASDERGWTRWGYHVAAMVFSKDDETGALKAQVFDPAIAPDTGLISSSDWIRAITLGHDDGDTRLAGPPAVKFDLSLPWQYEPTEYHGRDLSFVDLTRVEADLERGTEALARAETQGYDPAWGPQRAAVEPMP